MKTWGVISPMCEQLGFFFSSLFKTNHNLSFSMVVEEPITFVEPTPESVATDSSAEEIATACILYHLEEHPSPKTTGACRSR